MSSGPLKEFCCCGFSLQVGAKVIGTLLLVVYSAISLPFSIYELVETGGAITIVNLIFVIMVLLCTPLLTYVAFTGRKENFLLPWLILQMVYIIGKIFLLIYVSIYNKDLETSQLVAAIIGSLVGSAVGLYFWLVILSFYRQLKNPNQFNNFAYERLGEHSPLV